MPGRDGGRIDADERADLEATDVFIARARAWVAPGWSLPEPILRGRPASSDGPRAVAQFVRSSRLRLRRLGSGRGSWASDRVVRSLARSLVDELELLLVRPLLLEERIARLENPGDAHAIEWHRSRFHGWPGRRALFEQYPGLLRQVHLRCDRWIEACAEFLHRLHEDRSEIRNAFHVDAGDSVTHARMTNGDPHQGGRRVIVVTFSRGARLVYKPRPMAAARLFQDVLGLMNDAGLEPRLRTLRILDRGEYGWIEHVPMRDCRSDAEVGRYYRRMGALLAALHLVGATDCHFENVIASGENPLVVDLETLFRPGGRASADDATGAALSTLEDSVLSIGMLPTPSGDNLGALAVEPRQPTSLTTVAVVDAGTEAARVEHVLWHLDDVPSLPSRNGRRIGLGNHTEDGESGFRDGYGALITVRHHLLAQHGVIERAGEAIVRIVLRPTALYADLIRDATHPMALHDALQAERVLMRLRSSSHPPALPRAEAFETEQLKAADIPYFWMRADDRELSLGTGPSAPTQTFSLSGVEVARDKTERAGPAELLRQRGLIRTVLRMPTPASARDTIPSEPLAAARAIGERLLSEAVINGSSVTWLALRGDADQRRIVPVEPWLYDGLLGIALFLTHLHCATGEVRYLEACRAALREAGNRLDADDDLETLGVFDGLGGVLYAHAHISAATGSRSLVHRVDRIVQRLSMSVGTDRVGADLAQGSAGIALAALALEDSTPSSALTRLLDICVLDLQAVAQEGPSRRLPFQRGASHGWSGIVLALARLAASGRDLAVALALKQALVVEATLTLNGEWTDAADTEHTGQTSWCHGAPGIALCRIAAGAAHPSAELADVAQLALKAFDPGQAISLPGAGLCHGGMGLLEVQLAAERAGLGCGANPFNAACDILASGGHLDDVHVYRPGLMTGLAGIGLGLLRMADPDVPSVLTLDAPSRAR